MAFCCSLYVAVVVLRPVYVRLPPVLPRSVYIPAHVPTCSYVFYDTTVHLLGLPVLLIYIYCFVCCVCCVYFVLRRSTSVLSARLFAFLTRHAFYFVSSSGRRLVPRRCSKGGRAPSSPHCAYQVVGRSHACHDTDRYRIRLTVFVTPRTQGGFPSSITRQPRGRQYRRTRLRKALGERFPTPTFYSTDTTPTVEISSIENRPRDVQHTPSCAGYTLVAAFLANHLNPYLCLRAKMSVDRV